MWILDLDRWADNCAHLLRPGGTFYLLDIHPFGMVLYPSDGGPTLASSYIGGQRPNIGSADASYAVSDVGLEHQETHEWVHRIGDVVTALAGAGSVIDFLHEHPGDRHSPTSLSSDMRQPTRPNSLPCIRYAHICPGDDPCAARIRP